MGRNEAKKRVIVGMSAGVDSSVAAALLKQQGYEVVGVFLHFWKEPGQDNFRENKCCSLQSQQDARRIAQIIDIPLYTVNAAQEFKKEVVDYFLTETKAGRTPNPCVACNEHIKFNFLLKKMLEMDADFVATGHYAEIRDFNGKKHLYVSTDAEEDQTYFLYTLKQNQLAKILFPVKSKKSEVRKIAEQLNLPVFDKEDSQGLCFTAEKTPTDFIKRNLKLSPGAIMTTEGREIGKHQGLELYTIGQRKGINIGGTGPYFVVARDFGQNSLIVTNDKKDEGIFCKSMQVEIKNWIAGEPAFPLKAAVKIRYRNQSVKCIVSKVKSPKSKAKNLVEVTFSESQKAVTSGQSAVFYGSEKEVLGGGTIL